MRTLFGCLAALLCVVSVALAARYGYKGADTEIDGFTSATVFGVIAFCACLFDAAAVRLWFMGHRLGAYVIGPIAAAAFIVTVTNSLGAIASRSDSNQAERSLAKAEQADDRAELARITRQREALSFTPTTEEVVKVARDAVTTAERFRTAECDRRGPKCRERESEEQAKRDGLAAALTNQALTNQARKLDTDAARVRAKLANAPKVQNANPLGAALEQMIGATAATLTAWQQTIVAVVFELCLVGVMVIYELLGQTSEAQAKGDTQVLGADNSITEPPAVPGRQTRRSKTPAKRDLSVGSAKTFIHDRLFPANGQRIDMKALTGDYRVWCAQRGVAAMELDRFLDEIEAVCRKAGIAIVIGDDQRVYCLDVKLGNASVEPASVH
jgi:hypothetical protein